MQVKLLRVLQEQEFERLGSTRPTKVNVRVIAATNRDLQDEVARGRFRSDLFYRLNIFPIHAAAAARAKRGRAAAGGALRDRLRRADGEERRSASEALAARLTAYDWPGNVRELANVMERAVILCEGPVIQDEHSASSDGARGRRDSDVFLTLAEMERQHILRALAHRRSARRTQGAAVAARHAPLDRLVADEEARHSARMSDDSQSSPSINSCCRYFGTAAEMSASPFFAPFARRSHPDHSLHNSLMHESITGLPADITWRGTRSLFRCPVSRRHARHEAVSGGHMFTRRQAIRWAELWLSCWNEGDYDTLLAMHKDTRRFGGWRAASPMGRSMDRKKR